MPPSSARAFARDQYDVAIAGASFAGLAVASQLRGRALLVDHQPVGEGQTSACGTTLAALRVLDALPALQQVHHEMVLHLAPAAGRERTLRYRLPYAFCTFDYRQLCRLLADRVERQGVEFVQARALGWRDGALQTDRGPVQARCLVDATGWRASVASSIDRGYVRREHLSCGLEAELPQPAGRRVEGLHFWAGAGAVWPGYAWSFPCGETSRLGVIAYSQGSPRAGDAPTSPSSSAPPLHRVERGGLREPHTPAAIPMVRLPHRRKAGEDSPGSESGSARPPSKPSKGLREALDAFLDGPAAPYWSSIGGTAGHPGSGSPTAGRHLHGGFLPAAPRPPVVGPVVAVGDAAGHCFGLTGEGIRPALAFALRCGQILQETVDGTLTPEAARLKYRRYVAVRLPYLQLMRLLQRAVSLMADRELTLYALSAHPGPIFRFLMGQYLWPANPVAVLRGRGRT